MSKRAAVIGGGIAGLSAGIALRRAGYAVTLFEHAPALEPIGAAISIWGNAMAGLDWLGCGDALRARAVPVRELLLTQVDGKRLFGPVDISGCDGWLPMRSDLQTVLLDRLGREHCRFGVRVDGLEESGAEVLVRAAGEHAAFDLVVVADGIHSAIATRILGNAPVYRGYGGVIGVCHAPDDGLPAGLAQEIWAERDRFGLFDAGDGRRYWFYMAPFAAVEDVLAVEHETIIARSAAWPTELSKAVSATASEALIRIPIRSRPLPRALGKRRVICVGDAAHAMEPNQGQGGCQGIENAWLLGLLAERLSPEAILPEFERRRLPRIRQYWRDSALVGRAAHSASRWERGAIRAALGLAPTWLDAMQMQRRHRPPVYR